MSRFGELGLAGYSAIPIVGVGALLWLYTMAWQVRVAAGSQVPGESELIFVARLASIGVALVVLGAFLINRELRGGLP